MSGSWIKNREAKESEKTMKYEVNMRHFALNSRGSIQLFFKSLLGERKEKLILKRMPESVLSHSLNIARSCTVLYNFEPFLKRFECYNYL